MTFYCSPNATAGLFLKYRMVTVLDVTPQLLLLPTVSPA